MVFCLSEHSDWVEWISERRVNCLEVAQEQFSSHEIALDWITERRWARPRLRSMSMFRQTNFTRRGPSRRSLKMVSTIWTRMWSNAQRDGRLAEYRWRFLVNAAKFGWRPILECRAVTLPKRETRWNLQGCPKLPDRSQPLVGRSSPYCGNVWRRYCCLASFFSDCRYVP